MQSLKNGLFLFPAHSVARCEVFPVVDTAMLGSRDVAAAAVAPQVRRPSSLPHYIHCPQTGGRPAGS